MKPYIRVMLLLLVTTLRTAQDEPTSWNGLMDTMAEGLEHGMRWIKHRFHHCNKWGEATPTPHPTLPYPYPDTPGAPSQKQFVTNTLAELTFASHYLVAKRPAHFVNECRCESDMKHKICVSSLRHGSPGRSAELGATWSTA